MSLKFSSRVTKFKDLRFLMAQGQGKIFCLFSRCGETNSEVPQVPQDCLSFGHGSSAGCEDDLEGHKGRAFSGTSGAGRSETESEGSLHDLPSSLVAVGPANALGDMGIAGACGEYDFDGHVVEFENLQLAALAELGYLHCLNSKNSFICHSSILHVFSVEQVVWFLRW